MVAGQREIMTKRAGTSVHSEVTPQGEPVDYVRKFASTMAAEDVQELEQIDRVERAAVFAFPPDALGDGAQWKVSRTLSEAGITSVGTETITLVSRVGDRVTTERTFEVQATVEGVDRPPAADQQFRIRGMTLTGKATRTEDLRSLVPISDTSDSTVTVTCDLAGVPQPITAVRTKHVITTRAP